MLCKVLYYDELLDAYAGKTYIYKTKLNLKKFQKVIVPVNNNETKRALVYEINVPDSEIDESWAYRLKEIKEVDTK